MHIVQTSWYYAFNASCSLTHWKVKIREVFLNQMDNASSKLSTQHISHAWNTDLWEAQFCNFQIMLQFLDLLVLSHSMKIWFEFACGDHYTHALCYRIKNKSTNSLCLAQEEYMGSTTKPHFPVQTSNSEKDNVQMHTWRVARCWCRLNCSCILSCS